MTGTKCNFENREKMCRLTNPAQSCTDYVYLGNTCIIKKIDGKLDKIIAMLEATK